MEVILYSKECNWYTRCCLLNRGVHYRECPLREAILYIIYITVKHFKIILKYNYYVNICVLFLILQCCQVGVTLNYIHSVSKELLQEELKSERYTNLNFI